MNHITVREELEKLIEAFVGFCEYEEYPVNKLALKQEFSKWLEWQ